MDARQVSDGAKGGVQPNLARGPSDRSPVKAGGDVDRDYRNDDKVTPVLATAVLAAPILAVCCLGPIFYTPIAAWIAGWLGGIDPVTALVFAVIAGILAWAFVRRRRARRAVQRRFEVAHQNPGTQRTNWSSR